MNTKCFPYSNLHVHTPHSFSYFNSIGELVDRAEKEDITVLGINDFNTWQGYEEFTQHCKNRAIIPVYGIEVMALSPADQERGLLANDPKNPGRVYLGAKGIPFPAPANKFAVNLLSRVKEESAVRMTETVDKLDGFLKQLQAPFSLSYEDLVGRTPSGWVRERHIARALTEKIMEDESSSELIQKITGEKNPRAEKDSAFLQGMLRSKLLKAGEKAYVCEKEGAFLSIDEAKKLFLSLGGIPVYPILADGAGKMTDWEKDPGELADKVLSLGYHAVEFIPHRNSLETLSRYALKLHERGFMITAGSEHNSPDPLPLKPAAKDAAELPCFLQKIFWEGCLAVLGHQEQKINKKEGFVDSRGQRTRVSTEELIKVGQNIIARGEDGTKR